MTGSESTASVSILKFRDIYAYSYIHMIHMYIYFCVYVTVLFRDHV